MVFGMKIHPYLFRLSCFAGILAYGCRLEPPPEFSSICDNYTYLADVEGGEISLQCLRSDVGMVRGEDDACASLDSEFLLTSLCPSRYPYCLEDKEFGNGCVTSCPMGYHADMQAQGKELRYVCEKDSVENTTLYSMLDAPEFKEKGLVPRNDTNYQKNYIQGKFGAIPFLTCSGVEG